MQPALPLLYAGRCGQAGTEDILTYEEFLRLAALFAQCGVDTVRVTGGEPLVRKGVEQLVKGLKAIPGIRKVTMTTNAVLLEQQLPALLEAGWTA